MPYRFLVAQGRYQHLRHGGISRKGKTSRKTRNVQDEQGMPVRAQAQRHRRDSLRAACDGVCHREKAASRLTPNALTVQVRRLIPADAAAYQAIRLAGLRDA